MSMLCSVVIPLYNKGKYIEEAIQSVLGQSYGDFEIVIVDDGSTDDGASRVSTFRDPRIRLIQQANLGVSRARNRGIDEARGEIVCFLDADDWYLPEFLETIVYMAKAFTNASFFGTNYRRVSITNEHQRRWTPSCDSLFEVIQDCYARYLDFGPFFFTSSVAVRRQLLLAMKPCFAPGESIGEDQDLWFRLSEVSPLVYCPAQLSGYRIDMSDSLTASYCNDDCMLDPAVTRIEVRVLSKSMPRFLQDSALRLVARARVSTARTALIKGRRGHALLHVIAGWRGLGTRRWWLTLAMCIAVPSSLVKYWEHWRSSRVKDW